jgi:hypothetical protein
MASSRALLVLRERRCLTKFANLNGTALPAGTGV